MNSEDTIAVRRVLNDNMSNIVKNVTSAQDLLADLTTVLTPTERERITKTEKNDTTSLALQQMIGMLCRKSGLGAFRYFRKALENNGCTELSAFLLNELNPKVQRHVSTPDEKMLASEIVHYLPRQSRSDDKEEHTHSHQPPQHQISLPNNYPTHVYPPTYPLHPNGVAVPQPIPYQGLPAYNTGQQTVPRHAYNPNPAYSLSTEPPSTYNCQQMTHQSQLEHLQHNQLTSRHPQLARQDHVLSTSQISDEPVFQEPNENQDTNVGATNKGVVDMIVSRMPFKVISKLAQLLDPGDGWKLLASEALDAHMEMIDSMNHNNGKTMEVIKKMGQKLMTVKILVKHLKSINRDDAVEEIVLARLHPPVFTPVQETGPVESHIDETHPDFKTTVIKPLPVSNKISDQEEKCAPLKMEEGHSHTPGSPVQAESNLPADVEKSEEKKAVEDQDVQRFAFLICNSDYSSLNSFEGLEEEMCLLHQTLIHHGWDVTYEANCKKGKMETSFNQFAERVQGGVVLIYIAGHSVQVNGENYFLPVNADKDWQRGDVIHGSLSLSTVVAKLQKAVMSLIIPDGGYDTDCEFTSTVVLLGMAPISPPIKTAVILPALPGVLRDVQDCRLLLTQFKDGLNHDGAIPLWQLVKVITEKLTEKKKNCPIVFSNSKCVLPWALNSIEQPVECIRLKGFCVPKPGSRKFALLLCNGADGMDVTLEDTLKLNHWNVSRKPDIKTADLVHQFKEFIKSCLPENKNETEDMVIVMVVFSGLAVQINNENYLIGSERRPVKKLTEVEADFVKVQWFLDLLSENIIGPKIVVIDNPNAIEDLRKMEAPEESLLSLSMPKSAYQNRVTNRGPSENYLVSLQKEFTESPSLPYHEVIKNVAHRQGHGIFSCLFYS